MVPSYAGSKRTFGFLYKVYYGEENIKSEYHAKRSLVAKYSKHSQVPRWSCCCSNTSYLHSFLLLVKRVAGNLGTNPFQPYTQNIAILFDSAQVLVCCVIPA